MRHALAGLLLLHGLIHLLGPAKAFGLAALPQLSVPIAPGRGLLWLAAALLFLGSAACLYVAPRWWWLPALVAVALSTAVIVFSWADAKAGVFANVVLLVSASVGAAMLGPWSLRAAYDVDVRRQLARVREIGAVGAADLAPLPPLVQRYLRQAGVVGQPRVWNMRARMHGRIRSGPEARWMPFQAEQHNVFDEPARLFYMTATMLGLPADGYHRYVGADATMRVKALGLVPVANAAGPEMTRAETVTLFNDMCLMAPATLIDPRIGWEARDARTVRATFAHAGHTIRADLVFDDAGALVDFRSDDRRRASLDGGTLQAVPWSTPIRSYQAVGPFRLMQAGEGRWHDPTRDYAYIELQLDDVQYNVR
jgi:hypothetical protein